MCRDALNRIKVKTFKSLKKINFKNQNIRIISEGLCDTEDCNNDPEKNTF